MTASEAMSRAHSHGAGTQDDLLLRADRPSSFNPADIAVPKGREEDWRFTPMKRINFLFDEESYRSDNLPVSVVGPDSVKFEVVSPEDERLDRILAPGDRTAVVSWVAANEVNLIDIPAHTVVDGRVRICGRWW